MRVFISHSSLDRWVARQIARDLHERGIECFLDAKDIDTGATIDDEVVSGLAECDEFLVILSPASLASHWVLMEIGGAKALGKRIAPILLNSTPNDLPQPIAKHLARDINDIEVYYAELERAMTSDAAPNSPRLPVGSTDGGDDPQSVNGLSVGAKVRIRDSRPPMDDPLIQTVGWVATMDQFRGSEATVTAVASDGTAQLDVDNGRHWWAIEWIRLGTTLDPGP